MIGAAKFMRLYRNLTDKNLGFINLDVAQGMRGPTLNEVSLAHRDSEVAGETMGSLDSAVNSYLSQEGNFQEAFGNCGGHSPRSRGRATGVANFKCCREKEESR